MPMKGGIKMGWFVGLMFLGLVLIYIHRNHNFLQEFFVPAEHTQNVGRCCLIAGVICIAVSLLIFFRSSRLPDVLDLFIIMLLIVLVIGIINQSNRWARANVNDRQALSWSMRSFWLPAIITLAIIIAAFSC
jgi:amino acid permease